MALAIDGSSPAIASITNQNAAAITASFTPPAGSQLWMCGVSNMDTAGGTLTASSDPALTWTQRVFTDTQQAPSAWAWADVSVSQAYTARFTRNTTTPNANPGMMVMCFVITGHEGTPGGATATANSNSGTPTVGITSTGNGSLILAVLGDWAQRGLGTAGTSQTILGETNLAGEYTSHVWRYDGLPASGAKTINLTAPTLQDYNLSVVEIRAGAATNFEPPRGRRRGIPTAILNR
jgi:hypothetical protein